MREIEHRLDWEMPEERKTDFTKDELLDIIDFYLQYKPLFDESSTVDLEYPITMAAHDFTILLYKYGIMDMDYPTNMKAIKEKYGKKRLKDLSKEKLDFLEIITIFTFIHRGERHAGGYYRDCTNDGTYYNLLCRLEEINNEL